MEENKKAVCVLSGGLDSTTLLYDILNQGYDVHCISFDYGQKHNKELEFAKKTCDKLKVEHIILDMKEMNKIAPSAITRDDIEVPEGHYEEDSMKSTVVPNRNMVLISLATTYAISIKSQHVFYGAHAGDHAIYPDCRKEFVEAMQEAIMLCDWVGINLHAPYIHMDKSDIVSRGKQLNVDYLLTWTCYCGRDKACGKCGSCQERLEAFEKNEMKDPMEYE